MYWTDYAQDNIRRANLDGTDIEILWAEAGTTPNNIVLDTVAGKMYWTDTEQGNIRRANLDGTNVEILWAGGSPGAMALDLSAGKMYWSDTIQGVIRRADLDGSERRSRGGWQDVFGQTQCIWVLLSSIVAGD